ncbi:cysteine-rich DPF motif domain-containing protein 1 isoform X1 [Trichechus manatus latirostris]|uniref:Cysteine-rich DPF motif domain-containing protein 1 isoform X1 n=1 Tax=Trichechus manatus latirostris TaxID=127582 RepID=A0A2Y9RFQ4_TRIMA|nr:cysteine-rich DPF motif domain-containing protein 1 isoform X1 [Trichechus manatus latirostris]XP_023590388.1 cysteine-rich DPF motif domain-containing protein 1 isoform X1 [Trichechus manatus latirostris]
MWTRGKLWPGRPAASPVLGPEGSQGPSGQPLHGALGDSCGPGQDATELEAVVPGFIPGLCLQPGELSRPACSSNGQTQDKHLASPAQALQGSSSAEDPGALGVAGPRAQRPWDSSCPEREAQAGLLVLPLPGAGGRGLASRPSGLSADPHMGLEVLCSLHVHPSNTGSPPLLPLLCWLEDAAVGRQRPLLTVWCGRPRVVLGGRRPIVGAKMRMAHQEGARGRWWGEMAEPVMLSL